MNGNRSETDPRFRKAPHVVAGFWDSALEAKADVFDLYYPLARDPGPIVERAVASGLPEQQNPA